MPSIYDIGPHVQIDYERVWQHRLQETQSLLESTVKKVSINGERKRVSQMGAVQDREITTRAASSIADAPETYIRWLLAKKFETVQDIDEWDEVDLGLLASPQGAYMEASVMAYKRRIDATIISALNGNAVTGEDGTTLTALPSGQIVDEDFGTANSGLTFAKVSEAKYRLDLAKVPVTGRYFICSPQEEQDLIQNVIEVKSSDYTMVSPITDGSLMGKTWMGFQWITQNIDLPLSESDAIRRAFAYHRDYVEFGDGQRKANIDIIPDASHKIQIRTRYRMGATRRQEEGVVAVECYHA